VKTVAELRKLREEVRQMTRLREGEPEVRLVVTMGTCGIAAGGRETLNALLQEIAARGLVGVSVSPVGCMGLCDREPIVEVNTDGIRTLYARVNAEKARRIVREHVQAGRVIEDWVTRN
jgi:(2Fe-2S) ferredoxin